MRYSFKGFFFTAILTMTSMSFADDYRDYVTDPNYLKISSVEFNEVKKDELSGPYLKYTEYNYYNDIRDIRDLANPGESVGRVIAIGRDLVALGESVYELVKKGRPTTKTTYAPISVIPKVDGQPADIFETEDWSVPRKRTYEVKYRNLYNVVITHFKFSVVYSYGGKYQGKGAYLTAVQVIPEYVKTLWGWDFEATMKLGGIQNQGSRLNPVAGATVMIEYTTSSVMNTVTRVSSFFITGKGELKRL